MATHQTRKTLSATSLVGDKVVNTDGEKIGRLEDIMLDLETGRIAYAVLSFGGFLGFGDKLFALPWRSLRVDGKEHQIVANVVKEQLQSAPGFDRSNWPDFSDPAYTSSLEKHFPSVH